MSGGVLRSWGRYPDLPQTGVAVHWRDQLLPRFRQVAEQSATTLAYGCGRSYGDSCLAASNRVLQLRPMNRLIDADWKSGILRAEAGCTLGEILEIAIPRGWFLAVTPGTKQVTLGGAVANDVHGKNHHCRGTFGRWVRRFAIQRSDGGVIACSLEENPGLFAATIGGLGLTGIITWVEIQLIPVTSSTMKVETIRFDYLDEFFDLSEELDARHEYSVAWIDCMARGKNLGRGLLMLADHAAEGGLAVSRSRPRRLPFTPPVSPLNGLTLRIFNAAYQHKQWQKRVASVADYDGYFYPLDRIDEWNRFYGRRGFQQFQCVIPEAQAKAGIAALLETISEAGSASFLAVLKRCGALPSPGLLSFPLPGTSLALDFPNNDAANELPNEHLFKRLDQIVHAAGGRLYAAKDAHLSGADFRASYPAWSELERWRDPALLSHFWRRVTGA